MNTHTLLLYNKVHQAASESIPHHSALYYAVLWGYTEIIVYLIKEAKHNHIDIQDAFDLAQSNTVAPPDSNCLRMFCKKISAYCLNMKMYYCRKNELDELLQNTILVDTLNELNTVESYDSDDSDELPLYIPPTVKPPTIIHTEETEHKNRIEPASFKKPIFKYAKRKTAPKPPIGVPAIHLHFKNKNNASSLLFRKVSKK